MPLVDLSRVTAALRVTVSNGIAASGAWAPQPAPDVLPLPPEAVTAEALTLHLYAVAENAAVANLPGLARDNPLGLDLHYQLTAHSGTDPLTVTAVEREQLLLGLAMKVLHDHPRLEAGTSVDGIDVFAAAGLPESNSLSVSLRRTEPEQAVTWWTASPSSVRAAAYYTVSVAMIQETPSPVTGPPVLEREVFGFAGAAPHVRSTSSVQSFTRPGAPTQALRLSPAQVTPGQTFTVHGSGLGGDTAVAVRGEDWPEFASLPGSAYRAGAGTESLTAGLDARVGGRLVIPGMLRVRVIRRDERMLTDGTTRTFETASNETVVSVVPAADAVTPPAGPGQPYVLTGGPCTGEAGLALAVRVLLGSTELTEVPGAPGAGQFRVVDRDSIELVPVTPPPSGTVTRVRLLVNGAESPPAWLVAP